MLTVLAVFQPPKAQFSGLLWTPPVSHARRSPAIASSNKSAQGPSPRDDRISPGHFALPFSLSYRGFTNSL